MTALDNQRPDWRGPRLRLVRGGLVAVKAERRRSAAPGFVLVLCAFLGASLCVVSWVVR